MAPTMHLLSDERGGPLAEMAVLLLPFMVIIAMVIEGGNILWRHQIALKATRDTTRYLSRVPLLLDESCTIDGGVLALASASAKTLGISGILDGGAPLIPNWTNGNITVPAPSVVSTDPCIAVVQAVASVDLPLPFAPIFQIIDPNQSSSISFSVADQARWSGE